MKICSSCKSDVIEVNNRIPLKVILVLLLIFFVPYGLFLVWLPFLIPSRYKCKLCGSEQEPVDIDWREYEENKEEYLRLYKEKRKELERNLRQLENNKGYDEKDLPSEKDVKELSYVDNNGNK